MNQAIFKIREATAEDFKEICGLIKSKEELFLVYPSGTYPLDETQLIEIQRVRKELTVVAGKNRIVGFANLYDYKENESVFIGNVVIDKGHRNQGLGREIVLHMLNIAFNKYRLPEVKISVFSENTLALLLYSSFGFFPYGIEERKNKKGNRLALIHMKVGREKYEI